jgi:hypothetical protein
MNTAYSFYLCPVCFEVREDCRDCHHQRMIVCDVGGPGDERRKPVIDASGRLKSRAPRWFMEAVGWIPASYPSSVAPRAA